jgi:hypothetical protein
MPKLVNTGIQLQLHVLAGKKTIAVRTIDIPRVSSGLSGLSGTIGAFVALNAVRDLCVRKAWRHYCHPPGYPFAIQKGSQFYSRSTARWFGRYILPNSPTVQYRGQQGVWIIRLRAAPP